VIIEGSKEVTDFHLDERFEVDVTVTVDEVAEYTFEAAANLELFVDMPFPFSMTPKPIMEAAGNTVVQALLGQLMPAFAEIMVADAEGRYRRKRQH
jgi:hypothetical protein